MNIKTRPLMIGAGAGAAVLLVFSIIFQVVNYLMISNDPSSLTGATGNPLSIVLACVTYVCPAVVVLGARESRSSSWQPMVLRPSKIAPLCVSHTPELSCTSHLLRTGKE